MFELKEETGIDLHLPWPPSINHYYGHRAVGNRVMKYIGAKGKKFREDVKECLTSAMLHHCKKYFTKDVSLKVDVIIISPDKRKRDADNVLKATLDALTHAGVYHDDSQIDDLHVIRDKKHVAKPGGLMLRISVVE